MYVRSYFTRPVFRNQRTLVEFDLSSIPVGSKIDVATLKLYARYSSAAGRTYIVSRITGSWTEMLVTWNNKPSVTGAIYEYMVAADTWFEVDVKTFVELMLASGVAGFRVKDYVENSATSKLGTFCTKEHATSYWRPQLYVEWTPAAAGYNLINVLFPVLLMYEVRKIEIRKKKAVAALF